MDGFILRVPKIPCIKTKKAGGWHKKTGEGERTL
jgi:hypothetical protein